MSWSIHHVNLQTTDVRKTAAFYSTVLGMEEGAWSFPRTRGYIPANPDQLALFPDPSKGGGHRGLHLIAPDPRFAQENGLMHNPSIGGHLAIEVPDLGAVMARLSAAGIPFSDAGVFAIPGLHNIYAYDPAMNLVEINQTVG
ncbi:VOC family protein [Oceanibium sediminis]|uniref:VOC family protein n=1 Tax=Oceanibium sediminis TaxID=2026339 RepID=UPI000DD3C0C5|nr:VOC family protein [Oceanibium sediminis]